MNRRSLFRTLSLLPLVAVTRPAAAQIDLGTANYLRQWASAGSGTPTPSVGTAPVRPWDVQRAFEILSAAPRAPYATPFDTAAWFKDLKDRSKEGEPFNAEWANSTNPVITSFFNVTDTDRTRLNARSGGKL
jgi:hypothetical protein